MVEFFIQAIIFLGLFVVFLLTAVMLVIGSLYFIGFVLEKLVAQQNKRKENQ